MPICDVCSREIPSLLFGTLYTAEEFREIVAQGFVPPDETVATLATIAGIPKVDFLPQWKQGIVKQTTTGWLLCFACAEQAGIYLPKESGNAVMEFMLSPAGRDPAVLMNVIGNLATRDSEYPSSSIKPGKKKWWQFWKKA